MKEHLWIRILCTLLTVLLCFCPLSLSATRKTVL